jgi:hypothetical protein
MAPQRAPMEWFPNRGERLVRHHLGFCCQQQALHLSKVMKNVLERSYIRDGITTAL